MRNSTLKPTREMIAEASAWLIEFRTGDPNQAQRDRFSAWLCTSPQHIQVYLETAAAWSELPDTDPEGRIDIQQMIRAARDSGEPNVVELGTRYKAPSASPRYRLALKRTAIAASLVMLVAAGAVYLHVQQDIYTTETGEQRSLMLADGSTIELNAQTKVRVRYTDAERHIDLVRGQALFHVAKNKTRPFIVRTGNTQVRAVGTQFDVYRKRNGTIVTVVEGRVAVTDDALAPDPLQTTGTSSQVAARRRGSGTTARDPILLAAGEQLAIRHSVATKLEHPNIDATTAWTEKRLVFDDMPLGEVVEEFNRYNRRPLIVADPELQHVGVSGLYSSTDPSALIAFLNAQPGIVVTETETEIRIDRQ